MMQEEIKMPFDLPLPAAIILKAGELSCLYEAGNLRYITLGNTELVRKIYGAVRNDNWTTIPYKIEEEVINVDEQGFSISYTAIHTLETTLYKALYRIEGKPDNTISFSMTGTALTDFKRNRIGLCLHHPLKECKGKSAHVISPDGTGYHSDFPVLVSPTLPFLEIKQLEWVSDNGIKVNLDFNGDVFETEDQRNWSDGSFKTYSTRSSIPMPAQVQAGDTIEQKITVTITGSSNTDASESAKNIKEMKIAFPQIGYCRPVDGGLLSDELIAQLIKIPFDHYRVSLNTSEDRWPQQLQDSLNEAERINTRLELEVIFSDDYKNEITKIVESLHEKQLLVRSILVVQKDSNVSGTQLLQHLYPVIKARLPAVMVGYGTTAIFVDVNQHRPNQTPFDFISFGIQPQAHAFDNRSILENLQSQPDIMKTVLGFAEGRHVCISPVTIKDRSAGADERQYSSLVAFWTMVCLQNFSEAYSITFYDVTGDAGLLAHAKTSPTYDLFASIFKFQPVWVVKRFVEEELLMDGLLLENEKGERLFIKGPEEYTLAATLRKH